jgi:hypothetical protein
MIILLFELLVASRTLDIFSELCLSALGSWYGTVTVLRMEVNLLLR